MRQIQGWFNTTRGFTHALAERVNRTFSFSLFRFVSSAGVN